MKIITSLEELKKSNLPPSVMALGTFDGIHLGHEDVISTAKKVAEKNKILTTVFTFSNHPLSEIEPNKVPPILITTEDKIKFFEDAGVDVLISVPFTEKLSKISPGDFVLLLGENNVKTIVVGENFTYGYLGKGNITSLKKDAIGFNIEIIVRDLIHMDDMVVSSTNIRHLINEGNIKLANKMLGRPYYIEGVVSHGQQRGRTINFPTANLDLKRGFFALPKLGVYAAKVECDDKEYNALVNIGKNPTFPEKVLRLEAHLLGFTGDLYAKRIKVLLYDYVRGEIKFKSIEDLKNQIILDKEKIKKML